MLIIPAIDLRGGRCVRLFRGDHSKEIVYPPGPAELASFWERKGARWLHVVDLDGAARREFVHWDEIEQILRLTKMKVQAGGGITEEWMAKKLLRMGVERIVVSSLAFLNPEAFRFWKEKYGESMIVSLDVMNDHVKVKGWKENSLCLNHALDWLKSLKIDQFIYTDIDRDGTLEGINIEKIKRMASHGFRLFIAGGVRDENDLVNLSLIPEVEGVIIGRALLESRVDVAFKGKEAC